MKNFYLVCLPLSILFFTSSAFSQDQNANGLDDFWEYLYDTGTMTSVEDSDHDGFLNYEEAIAGTDPLSNSDRPFLTVSKATTDDGELGFQSHLGKGYELFHSLDLMGFETTGYHFIGNGEMKTIDLNNASVKTPITASFWADTTSLEAMETKLGAPDGVIEISSLEAPSFQSHGYTGRITAVITPEQSGDFNFYVTSSAHSQLYFMADGAGEPLTQIAEVDPTQTELGKDEWSTYSNQKSETISLVAGQHYFVDLRYVSNAAGSHASIGWSGPGLTDIEVISNDYATDLSLEIPFDSVTALSHDYDATGETGVLWPAGVTEITTGITGMSGNAERLGDNFASKTFNLSEAALDSFYATWLVNIASGHESVRLRLFDNISSGEIGRIRFKSVTSTTGEIEVEGHGSVSVNLGQTYRVEVISSMSNNWFNYQTAESSMYVGGETFDVYVSDVDGNLIGSVIGSSFINSGELVNSFRGIRGIREGVADIAFDSWEITNGSIAGNGYLKPGYDFSGSDLLDDGRKHFYRLSINSQDQDGDGISDDVELTLAKYADLLFFDAQTINGIADEDVVEALLAAHPNSSDLPEVTLVGTDAAAYEDNSPYLVEDNGSFTVTRTGSLHPLTVGLCIAPLDETGNATLVCDGSCCSLQGSAGAEVAEDTDYVLLDSDGNIISDCLEFEFGEMSKVITVKALQDNYFEYPETINIEVTTCEENNYTIGTDKSTYVQLFDKPVHVDNKLLFKGEFSQEPNSSPTSGSGYVIMSINGPRTEILITTQFTGLTSDQQDCHVHKANTGITPGDIVYEITEIPGDPSSNPLNGNLTNYVWDLVASSGAVPTGGGTASRQVIIDSLFNQGGETPLYLNIHTINNVDGEIWAFLDPVEGFTEDPGDAAPAALAGSDEFPILEDELLEVEVRRFLNQATFGAVEEEVEALLTKIETERGADPDYHRSEAFEDWIDTQMDPTQTQQTYLLDMSLAHTFQHLEASGVFDPTRNVTDGVTPTPSLPATWPHVIRPNGSPEYWYLSDEFPLTERQFIMAFDNNDLISKRLPFEENLAADWQLKINGKDQLRQKTGFALQQIVVVSDSNKAIRENGIASANWRDMLNHLAFSNYRELLGYANWSPVMGYWLSSIKNQKAVDFDGDGSADAFPDENLARENMQLFSIGLFDMWSDGTLALNADGLPNPTYTNNDIKEFAKVLTGQYPSTYGRFLDPSWGGEPYSESNSTYNSDFNVSETNRDLFSLAFHYPMNMEGAYHSDGAKTFAGVTIDNTNLSDPAELAKADIEDAIDWLAGKPDDGLPDYDGVNSHISVPAFISHRLIQRFTTSNPSKEYLHRVATVFKNSEGHLGQTVKAILLDPEARNLDLNNTTFGMKKSPVEAFAQLMISLKGHSYVPLTEPTSADVEYADLMGDVDYSNEKIYLSHYGYPSSQITAQRRNIRLLTPNSTEEPDTGLEMEPFYALSVFNFYLPDYTKSGAISDAGLVAPEMQIVTEQGVIRNINYFEEIIYDGNGLSGLLISDKQDDQEALFGNPDETDLDHLLLPMERLAAELYPSSAIPSSGDRSSESLEDEALVDRLDDLLTNGMFRLRYPYDDNDGVDNPREIIIDTITNSYSSNEYENKLKDALYLLTFSPEFQIRK